jgi:hypothetical protein
VTRSRALAAAGLTALGAGLLGGCAGPVAFGSEALACAVGDDAEPADGVVLMAQSVPTAEWIPCLRGVPLGWHISDIDVDDSSSRFWLDSDRHGAQALEVVFAAACDTADGTEIPSEREGMRRFEVVEQVTPQYVGARHYVFEGGCITVRFRITGGDRAEPLGLASQGIGVVSREAVRDHVHDMTDGRLELDPPGAQGAR